MKNDNVSCQLPLAQCYLLVTLPRVTAPSILSWEHMEFCITVSSQELYFLCVPIIARHGRSEVDEPVFGEEERLQVNSPIFRYA